MDSVFSGTNRAPDGTVTGTFNGSVTTNVYDPVTGTDVHALSDNITHLSNQLDLLHESVYVGNMNLLFIAVSVALIASISMFFLGKYVVTSRKGR